MNIFESHKISGRNVIIIILILKAFTSQSAFAQSTGEAFCGTPSLTEYIGDVNQLKKRPVVRSNSVDYYPLQIFSVAKSNGEGGLSRLEILRGLCTLNDDFLDYGLQFYLKNPIREINNDDYYEHSQSNGYKMMRNNNVTNVFNIYIVQDPNGTCGYFSPANEAVAIGQLCFIGGTHALTHEMGHYFGLPHTFKGWEKRSYDKDNVPRYLGIRGRDTTYVETVDGSNCSFSGDGFCDTPPDYISERWNCTSSGLSIKTYLDPNGAEFEVDGTNFMSYAQDRCQSMFTPEQTDRMHQILETRYSNRRYKFIPSPEVKGEAIRMTAPADQVDVDHEDVTLKWDPLAGAQEYIVQISILPGILFDKYNKMLQFTTTETEIKIPSNQLKPEQKYYWRIIPLNSFTFCPEPSDQRAFTPQVKSNTHVLPDGDKIRIYPNMIFSGQSEIKIQYTFSTARQLLFSIYNVQGQLIRHSKERVIGHSESLLYTGDLKSGLYLIHISDGKNRVLQKLMVQ